MTVIREGELHLARLPLKGRKCQFSALQDGRSFSLKIST